MQPNQINIHINQLVLHGFPPGNRDRMYAAIQQELTRLLTEQGIPPTLMQGAKADQIDGGSFNMTVGAKTEGIGTEIARSIYGGLGG
ncbi:MAG: hypothetical protein B0A82_26530 [Alkalinema sp. CACIAM 70d]|nr:MAG: hypothetical protein B0A82_26530 [Alkalinema sp. CACIAM 70d]